MAVSGDVITQDGGQAKLHPYLVALVRWCVSCVWSTATVLLHRLITSPLPQITAGSSKPLKPRPAGKDHLHPEPKVECQVLHQPQHHGLDVIFVHGLYGSLKNTWRQGEWKSKYQPSPEKTHLRRPAAAPSPCPCTQCQPANNEQNNCHDEQNICDSEQNICHNEQNNDNNDFNNYVNYMTIYVEKDIENRFNNNVETITNINEKFYKNIKKILPNDDGFTTEKFYNNTLLDQVEIIDNYETQANFVRDLFKKCDNGCETSKNNNQQLNNSQNNYEQNKNNSEQNKNNDSFENCKCEKDCEMGCGCICDDCYSHCWPKDWIKEDFPEARVISINYTSDPHLWRPLWIKENKRLCLHERAEQMMEQLLALGVGEKPVVWVGHSKGGLFIKQIYCEAYEAYLKTHPEEAETMKQKDIEERQNDGDNIENNTSIITENNDKQNKNNIEQNKNNVKQNTNNSDKNINSNCENECNNLDKGFCDKNVLSLENSSRDSSPQSSYNEEDALLKKSHLWSNSIAMMLYSVPHRGSPLADIKTPITARSVELIEISKDNALVVSLHSRWLRATAWRPPLVRSLVETRRTLMSVLWLRIVSEDSADPGIGALCGVSVDHREICKPSSRRCLLYTELSDLITVALRKYQLNN